MDNLERFKPENFTDEVVKEINSMSYEEISELADISGYFLIRDKSTNKPFTGQSTFRNFAVLHRLGHGKRFEVVGVHENTLNNTTIVTEEIPVQDEFITPQQAIIETDNPAGSEDLKTLDSTQDEVQKTEVSLQNNSTDQVKESEIISSEDNTQKAVSSEADIVEPAKEIISVSQDQEPTVSTEPANKNLISEEDSNKSAASAKTPSTENKTKKGK